MTTRARSDSTDDGPSEGSKKQRVGEHSPERPQAMEAKFKFPLYGKHRDEPCSVEINFLDNDSRPEHHSRLFLEIHGERDLLKWLELNCPSVKRIWIRFHFTSTVYDNQTEWDIAYASEVLQWLRWRCEYTMGVDVNGWAPRDWDLLSKCKKVFLREPLRGIQADVLIDRDGSTWGRDTEYYSWRRTHGELMPLLDLR
ncbi:uncharacterized protein LTR77_002902 [Saxophila tyrrhenica]|uniref:Uncharacterized protein n=1 Tax=Saxophila tyrrhenica TaxID=1690608 RepID=A0AAV9PGE5_9PEZI|nr:hypothetical protein LTR77_002902 [Saxophila tyrrhenica]